jgi:hypothetical protein
MAGQNNSTSRTAPVDLPSRNGDHSSDGFFAPTGVVPPGALGSEIPFVVYPREGSSSSAAAIALTEQERIAASQRRPLDETPTSSARPLSTLIEKLRGTWR